MGQQPRETISPHSPNSHFANDPSRPPLSALLIELKANKIRYRGDNGDENICEVQSPVYDGNYAEQIALNLCSYAKMSPPRFSNGDGTKDQGCVYEGGRRFATEDSLLPDDDAEHVRDEAKHILANIVCGEKLYSAPVTDALRRGGKILDLGTGVGMWAVEMGELFPKSQVIGRNLSRVEADTAVPLNVKFEEGDFHCGWPDDGEVFDLVFLRHAIVEVKLEELLPRVLRQLKPGGYFEIRDFEMTPRCDDGSVTESTTYLLRDYAMTIREQLKRLGFNVGNMKVAHSELQNAGFEQVSTMTRKVPMGPWWPIDECGGGGTGNPSSMVLVGRLMQTIVDDGLWPWGYKPLSKGMGWDDETIVDVVARVRKDVFDPRFHVYFTYCSTYGRKPVVT